MLDSIDKIMPDGNRELNKSVIISCFNEYAMKIRGTPFNPNIPLDSVRYIKPKSDNKELDSYYFPKLILNYLYVHRWTELYGLNYNDIMNLSFHEFNLLCDTYAANKTTLK
jgi:hypothetical protein